MTGTPDFANPPVVELVLSAQFSPLTKLSAGHFGLFWQEFGSDWTEPGDELPIQDQFEISRQTLFLELVVKQKFPPGCNEERVAVNAHCVAFHLRFQRTLAILVTLALAAFLYALGDSWLLDRPGVTKVHFDQVEVGMTVPNIDAILGNNRLDPVWGPVEKLTYIQWRASNGDWCIIGFGDDGRAVEKHWRDSTDKMARLWRWFRWP